MNTVFIKRLCMSFLEGPCLQSADQKTRGANSAMDSTNIQFKAEEQSSCTKLPLISSNTELNDTYTEFAEDENSVQGLDVAVHSPENKDSTNFAPVVLPSLSGSHLILTTEGSNEQLQKAGLDEFHDTEASKEQLDMDSCNLEAEYKEYLVLLQNLHAERDELCQLNNKLQMKLANYFQGKMDSEPRTACEKAVLNEQCYQKYLQVLESLKLQWQCDSQLSLQQAEALQLQSQEKQEQVESKRKAFLVMKQEVAILALTRRLGKRAALVEVERLQAAEQKCEEKLIAMRLKNIKLEMKLQNLEADLRAREELAKGMHLVEIEQLKFDSQNYESKIKERDEELIKTQKRFTSTVQVLTHLKEKLHFVEVENQAKRVRLSKVKAVVGHKQEALSCIKNARDMMRADNLRLRQCCGLLGNMKLLQDFEEKEDACKGLESQLDILKRQHAKLYMKCSAVKSKLKQSRPVEHCV